ncbi:MAG TPA: MarC family protein [Bacteroidales bacterium]|nr:MarC family protein [Bacteroidales bacterium]
MKIQDIWLHAITVFMGFFAMLNPIGNLPVFLGMVKDFDEKTQKRVAFRSLVMAFSIVFIFSAFGHIIFRLFGITLPAFQIAGGIIVFIMGYQLLNAKESPIHTQQHIPRADMQVRADDIAISPLGTPLLAGPGTISAAMNFVGEEKTVLNALMVVLIFAVMCVITYFLFISGRYFTKRVNPGILKVVTRLMGMILAVIAVQMIVFGVEGVYQYFTKS